MKTEKEFLEGIKEGKWRRKLLFNRIFRAFIIKSLTPLFKKSDLLSVEPLKILRSLVSDIVSQRVIS